MLVNENDLANNEKVKAETKVANINAILAAAPVIGDDETLKLICEEFELNWEEVKEKLSTSEYKDVTQATV